MNRREFLSTLVGGVFVNAAVRTWPFRAFSFPSKIVIPSHRFSFFEAFALNGPDMSEFLPSEFDMDLDTYMRRDSVRIPGTAQRLQIERVTTDKSVRSGRRNILQRVFGQALKGALRGSLAESCLLADRCPGMF